jgi:ribosome modulation factor
MDYDRFEKACQKFLQSMRGEDFSIDEKTKVYTQGWIAFERGESLRDCPYIPTTYKQKCWCIGWEDARDL